MRIAILSNTFPPDGKGGAEIIAALQADVLFERGHEVAVWSPGERGEASEVQSLDSELNQEGVIHRFSSGFTKLNSLNIFRRLAFHIADRGVNHYVAHQIYLWKPDA